MIHGYAPDAIVHDAATNSWSLRPDYDPCRHRVRVTIRDNDPYLDGDRALDEIGEDASQTGEVRDLDGTLLASGRIYDEQYYRLHDPAAGSIDIERIEIGGVHVAWLVTAPLSPGLVYSQTASQDVDDRLGGLYDTRLGYGSVASVPCFLAGSRIATQTGARPVEAIRPGDLLLTRDRGYQPVLWTGAYRLPAATARIVTIAPGALGAGLPVRRLSVSPSHRILVGAGLLEAATGDAEGLAAAWHLAGLDGIRDRRPGRSVSYHHLLLARHELVLAEGLWTETLFAGDMVLARHRPADRAAIARLAGAGHGETARRCLARWEVAMIVAERNRARARGGPDGIALPVAPLRRRA